MSFDWNYMQISSAERRRVLNQESDQSRLASEARSSRKRTARILGPVLYRMGGVLTSWGKQLQEQYGDLSSTLQEMADRQPESKLSLSARDRFEASGG